VAYVYKISLPIAQMEVINALALLTKIKMACDVV